MEEKPKHYFLVCDGSVEDAVFLIKSKLSYEKLQKIVTVAYKNTSDLSYTQLRKILEENYNIETLTIEDELYF